MTGPTMPRLYTVAEVAQLTQMSAYWLREQCRQSRIAHHRLGRNYRFSESDLADLMNGARVRPREEILLPTRHRR
jgi:excisionase family DNA binding protein